MSRKLLLITLISLLTLLWSVPGANAQSAVNVTVETIIENGTVFPDDFGPGSLYMTVGDLTNDGNPDLVISKGLSAHAAVFQNPGGVWDSGTLLAGPSVTNAARPLVAPIRNDGQNWLVYSEHQSGNTNEWLRAHRYSGTTLVENQDITGRFGWPGWFAPGVGDLNGDNKLEIWSASLYGSFSYLSQHLHQYVWDPATHAYPYVEIKDGGQSFEILNNPLASDFLGNGTQSLIWAAQPGQLDLVTYTPGSGSHDYTSSPIFNTSELILSFDAGEFDGAPGTDIVLTTTSAWITTNVYVISGGSFDVTTIASDVGEVLRVVRMGDLDGNSLAEVYAAGINGGIYGYDTVQGWRLLANHAGIGWSAGDTARWTGAGHDAVLFAGPVSGRTFRVISLTGEPANNPPDCSGVTAGRTTLWPPNHKFATIDILGVTDPESDPITITIDSIFQDEPVDAPGSGNTSPDGQGAGTDMAAVRAERVGSGNGRVYHISFTADDGNGGTCFGEVLVGVPKSQGPNGAPIDDGPLYDSTSIVQ